jgi:CRP-like cAMP-binding protein
MLADEKRGLSHLKKIPLFQDLSNDSLQRLLTSVAIREVQRRGVIYLPGDPGRTIFFVNDGRVRISKVTSEGKELTLGYRRPGDVFGEQVMIDGGPREEMAEAMDNATITELERAEVERLVQQEGMLGYRLLKVFARRRREVENKIEQLIFKDVNARLADLLLKVAREYGVDDARGTLVSVRMTHQEIANQIGSSRETVSQTLSQFKRKGLIEMDDGDLILANREGLRALA